MARAKEMGLPQESYHATNVDISAMRPSQTGASGSGVYTGKLPDELSDFANKNGDLTGGNIMPLQIPADKDFAQEMQWQDSLPDRWATADSPDMADAVAGFAEGERALRGQGFKGVLQRQPDWDGRVVFDPSNIRSRFARFDPRLKNLSNLSAAVPLAVGAGAASRGMQGDESSGDPELDAALRYIRGGD